MSPSRYALSLLVSCVALLSVACGGAVQEESAPEPTEVRAQATCTARCPSANGNSTVSCTGNTCQAVDGQYVVCDGQRYSCLLPGGSCTATVYCESLGRELSCAGSSNSCRREGAQSSKVCGGVTCNGFTEWCPPLPGDLECY